MNKKERDRYPQVPLCRIIVYRKIYFFDGNFFYNVPLTRGKFSTPVYLSFGPQGISDRVGGIVYTCHRIKIGDLKQKPGDKANERGVENRRGENVISAVICCSCIESHGLFILLLCKSPPAVCPHCQKFSFVIFCIQYFFRIDTLID